MKNGTKRRWIVGVALLCLLVTLGALAVPGLASDPVTVELYRSDLGKEDSLDISVREKEEYGVRFSATAAIERLEVYVKRARFTGGKMQCSLYAWEGNYARTIRSTPLVQAQVDFRAKTWVGIDVPKDQAGSGEWLFVINNVNGTCELQKGKTAKDQVELYFAQQKMSGALATRVRYASTPDNLLGNLSESVVEDRFLAKPDTWVATDGLDRTLPTNVQTGDVREEKFVGMFFWTWHTAFSYKTIGNVTQIMREHPEIINDYTSKLWGNKQTYFWDEPYYGYTDGTDPWVYAKQAEMLADAGVDVIIFDQTNGTEIFKEALFTLLETFSAARANGMRTPQVSFLLPFWDKGWNATQLRQLYDEIFSVGKYQDLWFYWKGKPLVMGYPDDLKKNNETDAEILDFFTFRPGQPLYRVEQTKQGQWGWLSIYPQDVYYNADGTPEQITVGVAQNCNSQNGATTSMNGKGVYGRTWSGKNMAYDSRENAKLYGANFAEQFEYALEVDPEFIFVTGWNEWRADRYESWGGVTNGFPDTFNDEYSRDLEPTKGELKDHYYYQLVSFIRRYKGTSANTPGSSTIIDIYAEEDQWANVGPYFASYSGDTFDRDGKGFDNLTYQDQSGRNDIVGAKLTYDKDYVYFMVETAEDLTPSSDPAWMRLFLDVQGQDLPNWETFDYVINRVNPGEKAIVERSTGGWNWEQVGEAEYTVSGRRLQIKVARSLLGIAGEDNFVLNFKWSDNMQAEGDIMDFYVSGDVAPNGRFKYQYLASGASLQALGGNSGESDGSILTVVFVILCVLLAIGIVACVVLILQKKPPKTNENP